MSFFTSSCANATNDVYTMAIIDSTKMKGVKVWLALANIGTEKRRKPYPPIFSRMPARITEPAVGASTWASGNHVCTGHIGSFTAKEAKKANHSHHCISAGNLAVMRVGMSVVPVCQYIAITASSISTEPSSV